MFWKRSLERLWRRGVGRVGEGRAVRGIFGHVVGVLAWARGLVAIRDGSGGFE